jgi:UDP-glucose 4-epimerase
MEEADAVVHLAALIDVEESVNNPMETHRVNVDGTLNVLNEAVRSGVKKFLFASSTAVYGEGNPLPLKEDYPLKPISPYAASKAAAEHYCEAFHQCYGLPTVILRFFNVYGFRREYDSYSGVITVFVNNALEDKPLVIFGDGEQTRDFVHVEDAVSSTILALEGANSVGEILNVCTGEPTSVNDLARTVKEVVGRNLQIIHGEPRRGDILSNYGDPKKAEAILGFKAKTSLREGLKRNVSGMH